MRKARNGICIGEVYFLTFEFPKTCQEMRCIKNANPVRKWPYLYNLSIEPHLMHCSIKANILIITVLIAVIIHAPQNASTCKHGNQVCAAHNISHQTNAPETTMTDQDLHIEEKNVLGLSDEGFHRLAYREWSSSHHTDNQPTIVCVHGVTRLSHDFDTFARAAAKDYRVICVDLVGRGNSSWLRKQRNYNFLQYCADINALFASLNCCSLHYLGTSLGGMIGLTLAAMHRTPIKSLVLNDIGPEPKLSEIRRLGRYIGKAPEFETIREARLYIEQIYKGFGTLDKEDWKRITKYSVKLQDGVYVMHYDPKIGEAYRASYSYYGYNLWRYWRRIHCPTLTLRGENSTFLSDITLEKMLNRGLDAQAIIIPDAAHAPMLTSEHEINSIKEFFDSVEKGNHQTPEDE